MATIQHKSLDSPDEERHLPKGVLQLARVGSLTIGRATLEPGWRWSLHNKPMANTPSCQIHHFNLVLAGRMHVQMDDGEAVEFGPGDLGDVPPGHDAWVVGDEPVVLLDVFGNIDEIGVPVGLDRMVTTLLMSDIVGSTALAEKLGDASWKQLLGNHNRAVRGLLERFRGREITTTGDGFLATFTSAVGALRCAAAIRDAMPNVGVEVRIGVHTGEVEVLPNDIGGLAVHAVSRIMAIGGPSEIMVSSVTRGLVDGSGLVFEARGTKQLQGLAAPIEVFLLSA